MHFRFMPRTWDCPILWSFAGWNRNTTATTKKLEIESSTGTQCIRYKEIYDMSNIDPIYYQFLREDKRILITKWRLSSHNLNIEKGRYISYHSSRRKNL